MGVSVFFLCKRGDLEFLGTKGTPRLGFEGTEWIQQAHDRDQLQLNFEPAERLRGLHTCIQVASNVTPCSV